MLGGMSETPTPNPHVEPAQDPSEGWGFWDETQTVFRYGYVSREDACRAMRGYADFALEGQLYTPDAQFYCSTPHNVLEPPDGTSADAVPSFAVIYVEDEADLPDWLPAKQRAELEYLKHGDRYDRGTALIIKTGDQIDIERDGGEPEDNLFFRDWYWVAPAIERAYEQGRKDASQ